MGIIKKTGMFFYSTLGVKSTQQNVASSLSRINAALALAKRMVSSLNPNEAEGVPKQFLHLSEMDRAKLTEWENITRIELLLWMFCIIMLFVYVYFYSLNMYVGLVLVAVIARTVLVGSHAVQVSQKLRNDDANTINRRQKR